MTLIIGINGECIRKFALPLKKRKPKEYGKEKSQQNGKRITTSTKSKIQHIYYICVGERKERQPILYIAEHEAALAKQVCWKICPTLRPRGRETRREGTYQFRERKREQI